MTPRDHYEEAERLLANLKDIQHRLNDESRGTHLYPDERARLLDTAAIVGTRASIHSRLATVTLTRVPGAMAEVRGSLYGGHAPGDPPHDQRSFGVDYTEGGTR